MTEITSDVIDAFVAAQKNADATPRRSPRARSAEASIALSIRARKVFARPHIEMLKEPAPRAGFFEYAEFVKVRDLSRRISSRLSNSSTSRAGGGIRRRGRATDKPCP